MDFDAGQPGITNTIELTKSLGGSGFVRYKHMEGGDLKIRMVFYERDRKILLGHCNRQFYVIAYVNMELKCQLIDPDSSFNIVPSPKLEAVRISKAESLGS